MFTIKVTKINIFLSEIRIQYCSIEPLRNLYYGILLNDMQIISSDVKSINKIIDPTDEVMIAYNKIILIEQKIENKLKYYI